MTIFKRPDAGTNALSAPNPGVGHHRSTPLPETPGHSQASLGQSLVVSLLLSPGSWCAQCLVCALQESVSQVLYKFWGLYSGINGNLLQEGLCHTQVCCTQSPCPCSKATADPYLCRRHSNTLTRECWTPPKKDTPRPRAKEKPQQDGRRVKSHLESNLIPARDAQRSQPKPCVHQETHRDWVSHAFVCLWVLSD